jgi:predicted TIM-barrel fold metal-dependent hydrolase
LDWFEPVEVLLFQMDRNQVDKAVLIQSIRGFDNGYLVECVHRFPGRFAVVGSLDAGHPNALLELDDFVRQGIQGIRFSLAHLPLMGDYIAILRKAAQLKLRVSCYGSNENFASNEIHKIIQQVPELILIVEHLAYPNAAEGFPYPTFERALSLAKYSKVYMKIHGFGEFVPRPAPMTHPPFDLSSVPPFIDLAIDAFGANRLMVGTDSPPCSQREGYANVIRYLREYLSRRTLPEQRAIFGGTAASLFAFGES